MAGVYKLLAVTILKHIVDFVLYVNAVVSGNCEDIGVLFYIVTDYDLSVGDVKTGGPLGAFRHE